jgi:hypothetical protein
MTPQKVDEFMAWVATWSAGAHPPLFCYLATERDGKWALIKGVLYLNTVNYASQVPAEFSVGDIRAGYFFLDGGTDGLLDFCGDLVKGSFFIHGNPVSMTGRDDGSLDAIEVDAPSSTSGDDAVRNSVSHLRGAHHTRPLDAQLSWLLRSAIVPFDSLQDLAAAYSLGQVGQIAAIDVVALLAAHIDSRSVVSSGRGELVVKVLKGFSPDQFRAGYRVVFANSPPRRGVFHTKDFTWTVEGDDHVGNLTFDVPQAAIVQAFATYADKTQQQWWFEDKERGSNPLRIAYETQDPKLEKLRGWLLHEDRKKATDYELGICVLAWLLGFAPIHLDRTKGLGDAPDVLISAPEGLVLIECTTGGFGSEKLSKLRKRKQRIRRQLIESGQRQVFIRAAIATSLLESETMTERDEAARQGVLFFGKESIDRLMERTARPTNTARLFQEFLQHSPSDPDVAG